MNKLQTELRDAIATYGHIKLNYSDIAEVDRCVERIEQLLECVCDIRALEDSCGHIRYLEAALRRYQRQGASGQVAPNSEYVEPEYWIEQVEKQND